MTEVKSQGGVEAKLRCEWCRRPIASKSLGRPRRYCRQSCRQRSYEARQQHQTLGLSESELIVTRQALESLLDQIYVLQAAVEDVDRDLEASDDPAEAQHALKWLLEAARPLTKTDLL